MDPAELLTSARVAHLATADRAGRPHVVPVCFVWLDGVVYTPIDRKPKRSEDPKALRRVRDILENPRVALVVDRWSEDWHDLAHVRVSGTASLLEHGPEWERAAAALVAKYPQYRALPLAGRPILRIAAERIGSWSGSPTRT